MTGYFRNIFLGALLALPVFLQAQQELSAKDQRKFDYHFYEASRYLVIERLDLAVKEYLECYKVDPHNSAVTFQLGKLFVEAGDQENGEKYLTEAYQTEPSNKWIALALAKFYQEFNSPEKAIPIYKNLAEIYPDDVGYLFELAQLYYNERSYKECLATLNQLEVLIGVSPELSQQKKDIYLLLDDEDGARKELEKLVAVYPVNIEYMGSLAQFYTANGYIDEAIETYDRMLELNPDDPRAHMDLANIYRKQEQFDKSYEHLKIAMSSPNLEVDLKVKVLYSFYQEGRNDSVMYQMGKELIKLSIEATPEEPKLYALLGDFELFEENVEAARNNYRMATKLGANQIQIWSQLLFLDSELEWNDTLVVDGQAFIELFPNQPLGYLFTGSGYYFLKDYKKSIEFYESGLDFVLDNPELEEQFYIQLADSYHRLELHQKSDSYFEKALEINPNNPTVLNNYAYYLTVRGVRLTEALEMAEKCNTIEPNSGVFLDTWAWALYKNGQYEAALEKMMSCAANGGATSGEVLEHWGDILYKLGKVNEAVAKWKEAALKDDASENIQQKIDNKAL